MKATGVTVQLGDHFPLEAVRAMDTGGAEGQGRTSHPFPPIATLCCSFPGLCAQQHCSEASTRLMFGVGSEQSALRLKCEHLRDALLWDGAAFSANRRLKLNHLDSSHRNTIQYNFNTMKASLRKRFPRISFCNKRVRLSVSRCVKRTVNPCLFSTLFAAKGDPNPDPHLRSRSFPRLQCQHFHFQITHTEKYSVVRTPKEYRCYFLPLSEMY